ncbi:DUF2793 domain-containing protein [Rhizobium sp. ARZ01]|uniref:DUF2793 domain-containing protein n=1 Tax=Rhizobium sp. ARZ01 TaxID=2769313 RepID=UPI001787021E|nr:DUF2793 domain-containing protein [Rhizobium sp. ARZ01]MBD9373367.1 DUF2793 domain-containing protein [Rhizobium sp. ARZ01]
MQDHTRRLGLPYILPSQAQKHVPHNEALDVLDTMVQLVLASIGNAPPATPVEGACFGVDTEPTGAWNAAAGAVAQWRDGGWHFVQPKEGWIAWCTTEQHLHIHDGSHWQRFAQFPTLGVNATPDEINRLSVAADASLLSHNATDHRLKINKASPADTASLIFQSNWTGHAELGLTGSNNFAIKVANAEGDWQTALSIDETGHVATPLRPAARVWLTGGIQSPAAGSLTGFTDMEFATGGFRLGAPVPSGTGQQLVAPASAHYLIALSVVPASSAFFQIDIVINGTRSITNTLTQPGNPTGRKLSFTGVFPIAKDEWIALRHQGGSFDFNLDKTELFIVALT